MIQIIIVNYKVKLFFHPTCEWNPFFHNMYVFNFVFKLNRSVHSFQRAFISFTRIFVFFVTDICERVFSGFKTIFI